ncbi:ABC transporter permease subunit [Cereibacter azotoformans]|uniref:Putative thiamine transport system permease protein n=1 Tax=Cereibacter azotoformans TaxID=43057 RepID=A0A2T5KCX8_9RHOB|nr:ABC transporter permease subunit [Cereibacter azotoformans]AXQ93476.1 ABC transporter permease subunit [Cereibacter sphaeroides]MBO4168761.1 ABC transporter permease subunit [Cereibacter azotoformans]PTR20247.1 putative thiamine transport system permease protein [Cereibacter azotoformans]UIJ31812.1 ABC transporter permease subunit [Cereibacter azotoformans]
MRQRAGGLLRQAPRLTLALMLVPVAAGLAGTIAPAFGLGGTPGLQSFRALADWPGLGAAVRLSLVTGLAATGLSLALTLLILALLPGGRIFGAVLRLLSPLLAVPHAAVALGLAFLIAPSGWIVRALSPWATGWDTPPDLLTLNDPAGLALIAGLVAKEVPFLLLMSLAALPQTDAPRRTMLAQTLGYGRAAGWAFAVLPALYAQIRLPCYAVLAYSMTAVEMAMILGPTRPPTLAVQIALWMADPALAERGRAAAAALLQLTLVLGALALWRTGELVVRRVLLGAAARGWRGARLDRLLRPLTLAATALVLAAVGVGLAGLALWSVAGLWSFPDSLPQTMSLRIWREAAPDLARHAALTLGLGAAVAGVALILALACLEAEQRHALSPSSRAMAVLYLPLIVPQVAFLPGLQVAALGLGLDGTPLAVAAAHLIFVLPYVFLSLSAPWRAWDARIGTVGAALGASPGRIFWRLRLPMLMRPVLTAFAVGLAVSVGQYLPTLLIGGGRVTTLTTEAVALSSGGNRRVVGAYALLQMLLPAAGFAAALVLPALVFRRRRGMRAA